MKDDLPALINLFKDPKSILTLPTHLLTIYKDVNVNDISIHISVHLKNYGLLPLMKEKQIIRVVNNINGESCLLFKCISNIKNFEKNKEIWLVLSLKKLFPKTNYWISLVDLIEETHETIPAIYLDDFSNQLEIARNLLNGGTASFRFHYYDPTSPFKLSLEKSQKLNLI